jgi:hypothetical protein
MVNDHLSLRGGTATAINRKAILTPTSICRHAVSYRIERATSVRFVCVACSKDGVIAARKGLPVEITKYRVSKKCRLSVTETLFVRSASREKNSRRDAHQNRSSASFAVSFSVSVVLKSPQGAFPSLVSSCIIMVDW